MWPNLQYYADLFTYTEEIFNGKLHFFCAMRIRMRRDKWWLWPISCTRSNSFQFFRKCCRILERIWTNSNTSTKWVKTWRVSFREKVSNLEFFWSVFSRIWATKTPNMDTFWRKIKRPFADNGNFLRKLNFRTNSLIHSLKKYCS